MKRMMGMALLLGLCAAMPAAAQDCAEVCISFEAPRACGRVTDEDGKALPGLQVALYEAKARDKGDERTCGFRLTRQRESGQTGEDGAVDFSKVGNGNFWLVVTQDGKEEAMLVRVRRGTGRSGCDTQFVSGALGRCTVPTRQTAGAE
jgi:hypothetical protein